MNTPAYLKFYGRDLFIFTASLKKSEKAAIFDGIIHLNMYGFWPESIQKLCEKNENFSKNFQKIDELFSKSLKNYEKICERNSQNASMKSLKNKDISNPLATQPFKQKKETEAEEETETKETIKSVPEKKPTALEVAFEDFWKEFPKQRIGNKEKAKSAFAAAVKRSGMLAFQLVAKAREYAKSDEVARGFAKGAQAWLNDDRFLRSYTPGTGASTLEEARENGYRIINNIFGGK